MYTISKNIRIRNCDDITFLININNNRILKINTNTYRYLKDQLSSGIDDSVIKTYDKAFAYFISVLKEKDILEEIEDGN